MPRAAEGRTRGEAGAARPRGGGATSSSPSSCSATSRPLASRTPLSGSGGARSPRPPRRRRRPRSRPPRRGRPWCARRGGAPRCCPPGSMTRCLSTPGRRRSRRSRLRLSRQSTWCAKTRPYAVKVQTLTGTLHCLR
uniref:Uncharacterized protein n=1 Tax=Arundo donax TaxID=35708 RepID=A0A0A9H7P6_ARUDO